MLKADQFESRDWRLPIAVLSIALLALFFWSSSRYPALNEKAIMGGDTPISGLSFDILFEILPDSGVWWALVANSTNWIYTNIKGMSFGVLFGAAALTLLSLVKKRSFKNGFANSALGTVIGAPLGVCVNCAVPIAMGMHLGRMRLETTLSAMLASPTLNVIVLTMSFALLPVHLAVIKLVLALVLVLLIVPMLCKFILKAEANAATGNMGNMAAASEMKGFSAWIARVLSPMDGGLETNGILPSLIWFVKSYGRNFFFIFIITVPMMLLAALLGAVVATFAAPNELLDFLPRQGIALIFLAMIAVAVVTSFVPAPIALDVILTTVLINIGLLVDYAMVALIGLGSFSIYAFIIIWRFISLRTAMALWISVIGVALTGGIIAHKATPYVSQYYVDQQMLVLANVKRINWPDPPTLPSGKSVTELRQLLDSQAISRTPLTAKIKSIRGSDVFVSRSVLTPRPEISIDANATAFSRIVGTDIGLAEIGVNSPIRELGYNMMSSSLAAGDVHGDGWIDIATRRPALAKGLSLYANIGGKFVRQEFDLGPVNAFEVHNLAFADVDGDSQLDLFVSTIKGGDFLFYNEGGTYSSTNMIELDKAGLAVVSSIAFADMDQDGDLDIFLGKWVPRGASEGWRIRPEVMRNQILWNEGERKFRTQVMSGIAGQSLTSLVSDFDQDGNPDLFVGDDLAPTDRVTYFNGSGKMRKTQLSEQPFPYHTNSSMSYDSGDWNNDLRLDYYGAQIALNSRTTDDRKSPLERNNATLHMICSQFGSDLSWSTNEVNGCAKDLLSMNEVGNNGFFGKLDSCQTPALQRDQALCAAKKLLSRLEHNSRDLGGDREAHRKCQKTLKHIPVVQEYCDSLLLKARIKTNRAEFDAQYRPVLANGNILMTATRNGKFGDRAAETNVRFPGWSWNSRFTDLDQDGWQDILVMTGFWLESASSTTNIFYHNNRKGFTDRTDKFGFHDIVPSYNYVTLDYDRDGDIDVVRDNASMRMIVHRNDRPAGPALVINLRDNKGNSMGIGARVTICVDGETNVRPGKCQMRTIKASGGFMSSDPIVAHFGLGKARRISLVQVRWPDGETSRVLPEKLLGGELFIERRN